MTVREALWRVSVYFQTLVD